MHGPHCEDGFTRGLTHPIRKCATFEGGPEFQKTQPERADLFDQSDSVTGQFGPVCKKFFQVAFRQSGRAYFFLVSGQPEMMEPLAESGQKKVPMGIPVLILQLGIDGTTLIEDMQDGAQCCQPGRMGLGLAGQQKGKGFADDPNNLGQVFQYS